MAARSGTRGRRQSLVLPAMLVSLPRLKPASEQITNRMPSVAYLRLTVPAAWRGTRSRASVPPQRQRVGVKGMAVLGPIEYSDAAPAVRAVYDDIKRARRVDDVNTFWKYLAHDPATLKRTWESVKEVMTPGALDALTKEMIYVAVSVTNGCAYCIASHTAAARKAGMTEA